MATGYNITTKKINNGYNITSPNEQAPLKVGVSQQKFNTIANAQSDVVETKPSAFSVAAPEPVATPSMRTGGTTPEMIRPEDYKRKEKEQPFKINVGEGLSERQRAEAGQAVRKPDVENTEPYGPDAYFNTFTDTFLPLKAVTTIAEKLGAPSDSKRQVEMFKEREPIAATIPTLVGMYMNYAMLGPIGKQAGGASQLPRALRVVAPTLSRAISGASKSGTIFGLNNFFGELTEQIRSGNYSLKDLGTRTGAGVGAGVTWGAAGSSLSPAKRIVGTGLSVGGFELLETKIRKGEVEASDWTRIISTGLAASLFEAFGAKQKTINYKRGEFFDIGKQRMVTKLTSKQGMPDAKQMSTAEAEKLIDIMNTLSGFKFGGNLDQIPQSAYTESLKNIPEGYYKLSTPQKYEYFNEVVNNITKGNVAKEAIALANQSAVGKAIIQSLKDIKESEAGFAKVPFVEDVSKQKPLFNQKKPQQIITNKNIQQAQTGQAITIDGYAGAVEDGKDSGFRSTDKGVAQQYSLERGGEVSDFKDTINNPYIAENQTVYIKELADSGNQRAQQIFNEYAQTLNKQGGTSNRDTIVREMDSFIKEELQKQGHDGVVYKGTGDYQVFNGAKQETQVPQDTPPSLIKKDDTTPPPRFNTANEFFKELNRPKHGNQGIVIGKEQLNEVNNLFSNITNKENNDWRGIILVPGKGAMNIDKLDLVVGKIDNNFIVAEFDKSGNFLGRVRSHATQQQDSGMFESFAIDKINIDNIPEKIPSEILEEYHKDVTPQKTVSRKKLADLIPSKGKTLQGVSSKPKQLAPAVQQTAEDKSLFETEPKLYRETSLDNLIADIGGRQKYEPKYFHEDLDLALGQGQNKGIIIKLSGKQEFITSGNGSIGEKFVTNANLGDSIESIFVPITLLSNPRSRLLLRNNGFEIPKRASESKVVDAGVTKKSEKYVELHNKEYKQQAQPKQEKTVVEMAKETNQQISQELKQKVTADSFLSNDTVTQPFKGDEFAKPKEKKPLFTQQDLKPDVAETVEPKEKVTGLQKRTSNANKITAFEKISTPRNALRNWGVLPEFRKLIKSYEAYTRELPVNMEKIGAWAKRAGQISGESNERIFRSLDGENIELNAEEAQIAKEIRTWLVEWADRLGMKQDERISDYITHIFPAKTGMGIPEEIASLIKGKQAKSIYNQFLLRREGASGYTKDTWKALQAYVKKATRKANIDPGLVEFSEATSGFNEVSQSEFLEKRISALNMRPTDKETEMDNTIQRILPNIGPRPTIRATSAVRKMISGAKIRGSATSFAKNLTQGVNTWSELKSKYTLQGYNDLVKFGKAELDEHSVLRDSFYRDETYNAIKKAAEKLDKLTFMNMEVSEYINKGAAYYGGKAKFLDGKTTAKEFWLAFGEKIPSKYIMDEKGVRDIKTERGYSKKLFNEKPNISENAKEQLQKNKDTRDGLIAQIKEYEFLTRENRKREKNGEAPLLVDELLPEAKELLEWSIDYGKWVSEKTQFLFGPLETQAYLSGPMAKTAAQFQTFTIKQGEFIGRMATDKEWAKLARYLIGSSLLFNFIGSAFGMKWDDSVNLFRWGLPPIVQFISDMYTYLIKGEDRYGNVLDDDQKEKAIGKSVLTNVVPMGAQIQKSVEGYKTVNQGFAESPSGKFQYEVDSTPLNYIKGTLFGKYNLPESKKFYKDKDDKAKANAKKRSIKKRGNDDSGGYNLN